MQIINMFLQLWIIILFEFSGHEAFMRKCYDLTSGSEMCFRSEGNMRNGGWNLWTAQNYCEQNSSYLLEIPNLEIGKLVKQFINEHITNFSNVILNLRRKESASWLWVDNEEFNRTASSNIIRLTGNFYYGKLVKRGNIVNFEENYPTTRLKFICSKGCPNGDMRTDCLKVIDTPATWYEARNICLFNSGDLAVFKNYTNSDKIKTFFKTLTEGMYWVGLYREMWEWQTSKNLMKYSDWVPNGPFSDETAKVSIPFLTNEKQWTNSYNNSNLGIICIEGEPSAHTLPDPTPSSKSDLNANIGIGVGCSIAIIIIVLLIILLVCRRKRVSISSEKPVSTNNDTPYAEIDEKHIYTTRSKVVEYRPYDTLRNVYANPAAGEFPTNHSNENDTTEPPTAYSAPKDNQYLDYADLEHRNEKPDEEREPDRFRGPGGHLYTKAHKTNYVDVETN